MQAVKSSQHEMLRSAAVIQQDHIVSWLPVSNGVIAPFSAVVIWFLWLRRQEFIHCSVLTFNLFIYGLFIDTKECIYSGGFWLWCFEPWPNSLCTCYNILSCGAHTGDQGSNHLYPPHPPRQRIVEKRNKV